MISPCGRFTPAGAPYWILDAVKTAAALDEEQLTESREVLRKFGNMSSATVMFVLQAMLQNPAKTGEGLAMAFGPGLTVESLRFALQGQT